MSAGSLIPEQRLLFILYTVFIHVSNCVVYIFCLVFVHFRLQLHVIPGVGFLIEMDKLQGCVG